MVAPAGPGASAIALLGWVLLAVCLAAASAVIVLAMRWSRRQPASPEHPAAPGRGGVAGGAAILSAAGVAVAIGLTFAGMAALSPDTPAAFTVQVVGRQWWWEVRYPGGAVTANELHLPAGQAVRLELSSPDVIHSFWVPALHGKLDLVPGRVNALVVEARAPGTYRGQCAEYCGLQHAWMAILVVAHEPAAFRAWLLDEAAPGRVPETEVAREGRTLFGQHCAACHAVRGTEAGGVEGPDLTHVGSRRMLAAGRLPNTRANLVAWIGDPQGLKRWTRMPTLGLPPEAVAALAAYLESLR